MSSSIFKALPEALRHPASMAMIGSVAFHGLVFAGVPLLPESSQAISSERLVRLIQLSPAERNRLPQISGPSTTPLPPAPPSDLSSLILPPLSELPDFSNQPNLGAFNPPPAPNAPSIGINPGQPLPSGPPISIPKPVERPNILPPPLNSNTPPPLPAPQVPNIAGAPPINFPENSPPMSPGIAPPIDSLDPQSLDPSQSPSEPSPPEAGIPKALEDSIAEARKVSGDPNLAYQNATVPFTYPEAACQDRAEGRAIVSILVRPNGEQAQEPKLQGDSGSKVLNDAAITTVKNHRFGPTGQYQAFLPIFDFKYSDQACSETATPTTPSTEGSPNPNQLPANPQKTSSSQSAPQKITIADARIYPKAACKEQLQGSTLVAATVKPNSQQAENLKLLSSSGSQTLDQAAIAAAKGSQFKPAAQQQNLELNYQFQYSETACPKQTPPSPQPSAESSGSTPQSSQDPSSSAEDSQSPAQGSSQPAQKSSGSSEATTQESSDSEAPTQAPESEATTQESSEDAEAPAQAPESEATTAP